MPRAETTAKQSVRTFTDEDAYKTFRVVARNATFTGETEKIGFSNGIATVSGLPASVTCDRDRSACTQYTDGSGDVCRVHDRVLHLNNLLNYPYVERMETRQGMRSVIKNAYRVLSDEEYEQEFAGGEIAFE